MAGPFDFVNDLLAPFVGPPAQQASQPFQTGDLVTTGQVRTQVDAGDDTLARARYAASQMEADGRGYGTQGPVITDRKSPYYGDQALGMYGVMGKNLPQWLKEAGLQPMTREQFLANPEAQDAVFNHRFGQYLQRFGNVEDAAQAWFAGPGTVGQPGALGRTDAQPATGGQPAFRGTAVGSYRQQFARFFREGPGQGGGRMALGGPTPAGQPGGPEMMPVQPGIPGGTPPLASQMLAESSAGAQPLQRGQPAQPMALGAPAPAGPFGPAAAAAMAPGPSAPPTTGIHPDLPLGGLGQTWSLIGTPIEMLFGPNASLTNARETRAQQTQQSEASAAIMGRIGQLQAQNPDMPARALLNTALADPQVIRALGKVPPGEMIKLMTDMVGSMGRPNPTLVNQARGTQTVPINPETAQVAGPAIVNPNVGREPSEKFLALARQVAIGQISQAQMDRELGGGVRSNVVIDPITQGTRVVFTDNRTLQPLAAYNFSLNGEVVGSFVAPGANVGAPGQPGQPAPAPQAAPGQPAPAPAPAPAAPQPSSALPPGMTPAPAQPTGPGAPAPSGPPNGLNPDGSLARRADMFNAAGAISGIIQGVRGFASNFSPSMADPALSAQAQALARVESSMAALSGSSRLRQELEISVGQLPVRGLGTSPIVAAIWGLGVRDTMERQRLRLRGVIEDPRSTAKARGEASEDLVKAERVLDALPGRDEIVAKIRELQAGIGGVPFPQMEEILQAPNSITKGLLDQLERAGYGSRRAGQQPPTLAPGQAPQAPGQPTGPDPADALIERFKTETDPKKKAELRKQLEGILEERRKAAGQGGQ